MRVGASHRIGSLLGAFLQKFSATALSRMWQLGYVYDIFHPPWGAWWKGGTGRHRGGRQKRECHGTAGEVQLSPVQATAGHPSTSGRGDAFGPDSGGGRGHLHDDGVDARQHGRQRAGASVTRRQAGRRSAGGTVRWAEPPATPPTYIFPFMSPQEQQRQQHQPVPIPDVPPAVHVRVSRRRTRRRSTPRCHWLSLPSYTSGDTACDRSA